MGKELPLEVKSAAMRKVISLCHTHLSTSDGLAVLKYLKQKRKLTDETIELFKLGCFPRYAEVIGKYAGNYTAAVCGLINFNERGDIESRFTTHNVIIPIYDADNNPIAVIGRSLLTDTERENRILAKYLNTSFKKGDCLFGLNLAKQHIREKNEAILVEGNFDVITSVQHGLKNIVATSFATLHKNQLLRIARYTDNIKLLFDNDEAGINGSLKAIEKYRDCGLNIQAYGLPNDVKDIDDYFKHYGKWDEGALVVRK